MSTHSINESEVVGKPEASRKPEYPNDAELLSVLAEQIAGCTRWGYIERVFPVLSASSNADFDDDEFGIRLAVGGAHLSDVLRQRYLVCEVWRAAVMSAFCETPPDRPFASFAEADIMIKSGLPSARALIIRHVRQIKDAGVWPADWWPQSIQDLEAALTW